MVNTAITAFKMLENRLLRAVIGFYIKKDTSELMKVILNEYINHNDSMYDARLTTIKDHANGLKSHISTAEYEILKSRR